MDDSQIIELAEGVIVTAIHTPCHTMNHVMFQVQSLQARCLFTGDCFFLGGVGRFFEGTADGMTQIIKRCLKDIRQDTLLFYGHDYGVKNLNWAAHLVFRSSSLQNSLLMESIEQAYNRASDSKKANIVSTGILWNDELSHNLFILAVSHPNQFIPQLFREGLDTIEAGVAALREDKSAFDSLPIQPFMREKQKLI